jgi:hypothetical protein
MPLFLLSQEENVSQILQLNRLDLGPGLISIPGTTQPVIPESRLFGPAPVLGP